MLYRGARVADHGRADRRPRAPGGRGAVPDPPGHDRRRPERSCSSATSWTRCSPSRTGSRSCAGARSPRRRCPRPARPEPSSPDLMVGRTILEAIERTPVAARRRSCSRCRTSRRTSDKGSPALRDVSLDVRAGEIVGIAGVAGNGQSELAEVITGLRACSGRVPVRGEDAGQPAPSARHRRGRGARPGGPPRRGQRARPVAGRQPDHEELPRRRRSPAAGRSTAAPPGRSRASSRTATRSRRRRSTPQARLLSGGNLQRLIFAREIESHPSLIIAVQPTRGLDVGAVETVHRLLLERRAAGAAILLISEELDELLALADRVAVIYEGRIVGLMDAADADVGRIGLLMTGGGSDGPVAPAVEDAARVTATARRAGSRLALPCTVRLERRLDDAALAVARADGRRGGRRAADLGLLIAVVGGDPIRVVVHIVGSSFGNVGVLSDTLVKATPLIFTGLACALAFRMRLWNIGAEGQLLLGAWGAARGGARAAGAGRARPAVRGHPGDARRGLRWAARCGADPGLLKARFNVNEIITTLMLNYIAIPWVRFWVFGPWSEGGFQLTEQFPRDGWLPRLTRLREHRSRPRGADRPPRVPARAGRGLRGLVLAQADAQGLRDPAHRRQPAGRPLRGHQHRPQRHPGGVRLGRPGRARRHGRGQRRRPPAPGRLLAGLRLHGVIIAYLAKFNPLGSCRVAILFGALDPRRPRDPAVRGPGDDPGDHAVLRHRERGLPPLPGPHRPAGAGRDRRRVGH